MQTYFFYIILLVKKDTTFYYTVQNNNIMHKTACASFNMAVSYRKLSDVLVESHSRTEKKTILNKTSNKHKLLPVL